ncbi:MAG TPA: cytochrome c [Bdellovibrionales bacterium]|nr:cytochrome c [Bdellovibrionales bacterium]
MSRLISNISILIAAVLLAGCNAGPNQTNIEIMRNMFDQISVKSQDWDPRDGDKTQMRTPPAHTVARGQKPYKYADDPVAADKEANPYAGDSSAELLTVGHKKYEIYCGICHGATGDGAGPVADKMAVKPRNLLLPDALAYTDGRIHNAIVMGRGVMGPYGSQIPNEKDRWAIVNYVRTLQKAKK